MQVAKWGNSLAVRIPAGSRLVDRTIAELALRQRTGVTPETSTVLRSSCPTTSLRWSPSNPS